MKSSFSIPVTRKVLSASLLAKKYRWQDLIEHDEFLDDDPGPDMETEGVKPTDPQGEEDNFHGLYTREEIEKKEGEAFKRGFEEGRRKGMEEGRVEARAELEPHIQLFIRLVQELKQEKETFYQENELYIVKLAIEIARKIIQRELTQNPDILLYVVREALKRITNKGRIVIRTNPDDLGLIQKDKEFMDPHLQVFEQVDFVASENVQRGGCVIESESGIVDAQLDVQLEKIEQSLLEGVTG